MKITLIGSGSWGTAIAGRAAFNGNDVIMWSHSEECARGINEQGINPRYLTHYELPKNVSATTDIVKALECADGIIFAVPSTHLREIANQAAPYICETTPILCLTKGIESTTGLLMNEVIGDECGHPERIAALSGPNHAEEVCQGQLSAAVIAAEDNDVASFFKGILLAPEFRIYLSGDVIGVEMCGAVKNIIAIVCGIRRQHPRAYHDPRTGRNQPSCSCSRRRGPHLYGSCRNGRPCSNLHIVTFAKPFLWPCFLPRHQPGAVSKPNTYGRRGRSRSKKCNRTRPHPRCRRSAYVCPQ